MDESNDGTALRDVSYMHQRSSENNTSRHEEQEDIFEIITSVPDQLVRRMDEVITTQDISFLVEAFEYCLVMDWRMFSERWLKLTVNHTENIDQDCKKRPLKYHGMFDKWKEMLCENATIRNISGILRDAKLEGILQRWFSCYKPDQKDAIESFLKNRKEVLMNTSDKSIAEQSWSQCILKLGMDDKEEEVNEKHRHERCGPFLKKKELLQMFQNRFGFSREKVKLFDEAVSMENHKPARRIPSTYDTNKVYPFVLRPVGNVKKCQGCQTYLDQVPSKDDMVIAHIELITYKSDGELVEHFTHGHYHNDERCVKTNHPNFNIKADLVHN